MPTFPVSLAAEARMKELCCVFKLRKNNRSEEERVPPDLIPSLCGFCSVCGLIVLTPLICLWLTHTKKQIPVGESSYTRDAAYTPASFSHPSILKVQTRRGMT